MKRPAARLLVGLVIAGVGCGVAAAVMLSIYIGSRGDPLWLHVAQWLNRALDVIAAAVVIIVARFWCQVRHKP